MDALAALMCMLPWQAATAIANALLLTQGLWIVQCFCKGTLRPQVHVNSISRPALSLVLGTCGPSLPYLCLGLR